MTTRDQHSALIYISIVKCMTLLHYISALYNNVLLSVTLYLHVDIESIY